MQYRNSSAGYETDYSLQNLICFDYFKAISTKSKSSIVFSATYVKNAPAELSSLKVTFLLVRKLNEKSIGHVRYINILTWFRGFQVKLLCLVLFSLYLSLFWELRDIRNVKNLQF